MFSVNVKTQPVRGEMHYHATMTSHLGNIVGILLFTAEEWGAFLAICMKSKIKVTNNAAVQATVAETATAR